MRILAIESSCDETAAAVLESKSRTISATETGAWSNKDKIKVLSNIVASQIAIHKKTGGVVPEVASREHIKTILPVIKKALKLAFGTGDFKKQLGKIDYIAVTNGPGLMGSLLVGVQTAKTLGWLANKPVIPVNHLHGHVYANFLSSQLSALPPVARLASGGSSIQFPAIVLIVSGGHTQLVLMKGHGNCKRPLPKNGRLKVSSAFENASENYKILGETVDDAAGEAFDKVGKLLNLEYPGGPVIEKLAKKGNPKAFAFPRPMLKHNNFDFSFSGLKTAVFYELKKQSSSASSAGSNLRQSAINDICASFQQAVIDVLVGKSLKAIEKHKPKSFLISGGVAANSTLVQVLSSELRARNTMFFYPEKPLCTDNAAMIGAAAFYKLKTRNFKQRTKLNAEPNLTL